MTVAVCVFWVLLVCSVVCACVRMRVCVCVAADVDIQVDACTRVVCVVVVVVCLDPRTCTPDSVCWVRVLLRERTLMDTAMHTAGSVQVHRSRAYACDGCVCQCAAW